MSTIESGSVSLDQYLAQLLTALPVTEALEVGTFDAVGLVLSSDVLSMNASPRDTVAACDGVVVRANDTTGATLTVPIMLAVTTGTAQVSDSQAASSAQWIGQGEPLPYGYDAIVPVGANFDGSRPLVVTRPVLAGQQVATAGSDIAPHQVLAVKGHVVTAGDVALLATAGVEHIQCVPAPRIVVLGVSQDSTAEFTATQASDTRAVTMMVAGYVRSLGAMVFIGEEISATRDALAQSLDANLGRADLIILVGGTRLYTKPRVAAVLAALGSVHVRALSVETCTAQLYGTVATCPVVAVSNLPGAAHREFELLLRPAIRHLQGRRDGARPRVSARLAETVIAHRSVDRFVAMRLQRIDSQWVARPLSENTAVSSVTVAQTDGYLKVGSGQVDLVAGMTVEIELVGE